MLHAGEDAAHERAPGQVRVLLTDKQREIATDYFLNDLSLGEIAEAQGISRQAVYDTLVRAERAMEGYEAQFGACRPQRGASSCLANSAARLREARDHLAKGNCAQAGAVLESVEEALEGLLRAGPPVGAGRAASP